MHYLFRCYVSTIDIYLGLFMMQHNNHKKNVYHSINDDNVWRKASQRNRSQWKYKDSLMNRKKKDDSS